MHKRLVSNIVSRILFVVSLFMLIPLGWALADNAQSLETQAFIITIALGLFLSFVILAAFSMTKDDVAKINTKDGLAIVGLSWLVVSLFGALPFYLSHSVPNYTDAFFETVSGFTTTGASIMTNIEGLPRGILFWRSLTHWLGGMGIIVLCLALLPALGHNAYQLYKAESPGITAERLQPRIKETAKILWSVYLLLSLTETVLLMLGKMPLFDALCHTFGTMATGGFSTKTASIGFYSPYIQWVVTVFMFLAGANFMLHYFALKGNLKAYFESEEFRYYCLFIGASVLGFFLVLKVLMPIDGAFRHASFQVVSIMTTTGYATTDTNVWPNVLRFGLICLMFVGGCGGSTGGGMKVVRFVLALKMAVRSIVQSVFPNAVLPVRYNNAPVPSRLQVAVASYVLIFMFLFFAGTALVILFEGCDLATGLSASIATLSNIGPGLGKIGATQNYAWMTSSSKWILTFLMLAGRLELYSILILLIPSTWRK